MGGLKVRGMLRRGATGRDDRTIRDLAFAGLHQAASKLRRGRTPRSEGSVTVLRSPMYRFRYPRWPRRGPAKGRERSRSGWLLKRTKLQVTRKVSAISARSEGVRI
jgi:hypothetical protein